MSRVDKAKEVLASLVDRSIEEGRKTSTNFVVVTSDTHYERYNDQCHYYISTKTANIECVASEFAVRRRAGYYGMDVEVFRPMVQFLLTCPLWKEYILSDEAFGMEYGFVVSAEAPQNLLQSLMVMSRSFMEASEDAFLLFNEAVSKGMPELVAYIFAFQSTVSTRDYTESGLYPSASNGHNGCAYGDAVPVSAHTNHRPWNLLGYAALDCLLEGKYTPTPSYSVHQSIHGTVKMFPTDTNLITSLANDKDFNARLLQHRKGTVTELYRVPNPFAKPDPNKPKPLSTGQIGLGEYKEVALAHLVDRYAPREEIRCVA